MADYGIFGHGSSGNSWFANKLDDFHDSTKKYDPISHYAVEWPMKGAHWLVEKSSKGLANAGIGEGFNTRLNQEADENGNNFGLGSQRMGLGILSVLGGMYAAGAAGAGSGGSAAGGSAAGGGAAAGGAAGAAPAAGNGAFLGEGVASGVGAWDGAAGGMGLGFNPDAGLGVVNGDFAGTQTSGNSMSSLLGQGGGGQGGQMQAQQGMQAPPPNMGNPALTAALAKLVGDQEEAKRQEQQGPFAQALNYQQKPQNESWDEILRRFSQQYAANNQGGQTWQG